MLVKSYLQNILPAGIEREKRLRPGIAWKLGQLASGLSEREQAILLKYLESAFSMQVNQQIMKELVKIYHCFPEPSLISDRLFLTHYRLLCKVENEKARYFYHEEALKNQWSTRQLQRQVRSRFYERVNEGNSHPLRAHYILEFAAGHKGRQSPAEKELEQELINRLQDFILELGSGFAFVARQKRLATESGKSFYVDLVFYHYYLRCFVLFDLKIGPLTYSDIGQIDLYVRYFNEHYRLPGDRPTAGAVLCTEKDHTLVHYSILSENPDLHAATYQLYLPEEEALARAMAPPP